MKLLIATTNPAKYKDYKNILDNFNITTTSLEELKITDDVEETGTTLEENATLKASYYSKLTGLPALSDDSGFQIDALNGEPGVYSRRWPGYDATDQELIDMVESKLKNVPLKKRTAKFCNMTVLADKGGNKIASGAGYIDGFIPLKACEKRWDRFPYRSVLFVPQFDKFWGELSEEEFKQLNFRHKSVESILSDIKKLI